ncbi:transglutaminase-like domain-containing protein [Natribacillus halophilus]|uniref:Transglutaminase-like enzyme, putative cysteine protease n=1 Tax=Natribacillus halophilus TaxID=549003 RepID=A0A1G8QIQ0_9BACI|nr:transglutaminase-like domain-containing protein [Natribacillus halophilus]SDJ03970.1 Transglutaminase-like enzyme, putative cysteine protease [Natribacillus halophilus]
MKWGRASAVLLLLLLTIACSDEEQAEGENEEEATKSKEDLSAAANIETEELENEPYGEDIGLTVEEPLYETFAAEGSFTLEGNIEANDSLNEDYLWVILDTGFEDETEAGDDSFEYFVPIAEDGSFAENIVLHSGEYDHQVTVRIPSNDSSEEDTFYDGVQAEVHNVNQEIQREVEYTQLGHEYGLSIEEPAEGYMEVGNTVPVAGTLPDAGEDDLVMIQVDKDGEDFQFTVPVENGAFEADIPLSFGEGIHTISVMVYVEEEELYYDGAYFLAEADSDEELVQVETYNEYYENGIELVEPTNTSSHEYEGNEFRIAGEIDPEVGGADEITHMIVTTEYEDETANYYLPVEDYAFDDTIWFRFGEGEYDITVSVPEPWEDGNDYFEFFGVASFSQEVEGAEDQRSLLPSVGIESDDPRIEEVAEEATEGLDDDRDKAEAVYEYVATNVSYDVEKLEDNLFEMDDSALKTLETEEGVCQDYAFLAIAMLRSLGMEANYVAGNVGLERHAWVEVMVDGEWLEMDPTWGAGYIEDDEFVFDYNEDYFDPDEDFLEETHNRTEIIY